MQKAEGRRQKVQKNFCFLLTALCILEACFLITGCGKPTTIGKDWEVIQPPVTIPDFALTQLDGTSLRISELRGDVVIMEFWATWCGPCRFSLPSLEVIYKKYQDRDVTVVLINEGEDIETIEEWMEDRFTATVLLDEDESVGRMFNLRGLPRLFVINQDGAMVYAHEGYGGGLEHNLELILEDLLSNNEEI